MSYFDWFKKDFWNLFSLGFLFALGLVWGVFQFVNSDVRCSRPGVVNIRYTIVNPSYGFCASVSSRSGWNEFEFPTAHRSITYVGGSWSVDASSLFPVGAEGYDELWESDLSSPAFRYTEQAPIGGLLIEDEKKGLLWTTSPGNLSKSHRRIRMRINESDEQLSNNQGALTVCFGQMALPR